MIRIGKKEGKERIKKVRRRIISKEKKKEMKKDRTKKKW